MLQQNIYKMFCCCNAVYVSRSKILSATNVTISGKGEQVKAVPLHTTQVYGEAEVQLQQFLTSEINTHVTLTLCSL
jgi:hypothetical protein